MIEVDNVSKKFTKQISKKQKETFYADKSITFKAKEGEILGILGPNGAGKTTLLRMLSGLLTPDEGVITIDKITTTDEQKIYTLDLDKTWYFEIIFYLDKNSSADKLSKNIYNEFIWLGN